MRSSSRSSGHFGRRDASPVSDAERRVVVEQYVAHHDAAGRYVGLDGRRLVGCVRAGLQGQRDPVVDAEGVLLIGGDVDHCADALGRVAGLDRDPPHHAGRRAGYVTDADGAGSAEPQPVAADIRLALFDALLVGGRHQPLDAAFERVVGVTASRSLAIAVLHGHDVGGVEVAAGDEVLEVGHYVSLGSPPTASRASSAAASSRPARTPSRNCISVPLSMKIQRRLPADAAGGRRQHELPVAVAVDLQVERPGREPLRPA